MANEDLRKHVLSIVETIENGATPEYSDESEGFEESDEMGAFDYLQDVLDIEYIVDSKREYLGARVLVAFGGPNIWINTRTKQVEGYWWSDEYRASYDNDAMGLDDALSELYNC